MLEHEQENARLRTRIAELEACLARLEPVGIHSNQHFNGQQAQEEAIDAKLLGAALASLSDGIVICNSAGRLLHFNPVAMSMFGQVSDAQPSEWSARYGVYYDDGETLFPANELPLARAMRGESIDGVELFTRTAARPEGAYIECSARPIHGDDGTLQGAVVVCRDIGERKQAAAERVQRLHAEEQRLVAEKKSLRMANILQALLDHLDVVVWCVDEKGVFNFHDGRGSEPMGIPRGSFIGKNIFELYPGSTSLQRALEGVPQHDVTVTGKFALESWYVPVQDEGGGERNVIGLSLNITDAYQATAELEAKLSLIERQQAVINDLETPIIQVWDRILTLPMVGMVDSRRAARLTDDLLNRVSRTQAYFAILDLTGVEVVDTATAGHMLNIISAVRLLGAEGIITGIRPNIAQTIISLGVDLSRVRTLATLRDGLAFAIRKLAEREAVANTPFLQPMHRGDT